MFVGITNTPRDYAWGSTTAIAELLGREPSSKPEAELWLGAHPGSPSIITDPDPEITGGPANLLDFIAADPARALGTHRSSDTLPFLLKILAAAQPLSLQAHPSLTQAEAGFARENEEGVPITAPFRNYKDTLHKPELVYALSDTFEALAGFRDLGDTEILFEELIAVARTLRGVDPDPLVVFLERITGVPETVLRDAVGWLLGGTDDVKDLVGIVSTLVAQMPKVSSFAREYATAVSLAEYYPGDPGIVISLLLNRVTLPQGEALYLPSGNIHAYLSGLGVELMAASDNVLRGGLTPKHIDVGELLAVLDFTPIPAPVLAAEDGADGVAVYRPDVPDFLLAKVSLGEDGAKHGYRLSGPEKTTFPLAGPAIAIATDGAVAIVGAVSSTVLDRGDAAFITPDEVTLELSGSGTVFIATLNR